VGSGDIGVILSTADSAQRSVFWPRACFYLYLNAEFLGLVQLMVYVGAVAVLILFTVLLTRPRDRSG
jgi:NADH:ubiquinone oxidoreductase subunit 6 (subunit J)